MVGQVELLGEWDSNTLPVEKQGLPIILRMLGLMGLLRLCRQQFGLVMIITSL